MEALVGIETAHNFSLFSDYLSALKALLLSLLFRARQRRGRFSNDSFDLAFTPRLSTAFKSQVWGLRGFVRRTAAVQPQLIPAPG